MGAGARPLRLLRLGLTSGRKAYGHGHMTSLDSSLLTERRILCRVTRAFLPGKSELSGLENAMPGSSLICLAFA